MASDSNDCWSRALGNSNEMQTRLLNEDEFKATMVSEMYDVTERVTEAFDIWPYVRSIPAADLENHWMEEFVDSVYRSEDRRFAHVLVVTRTMNVYVVVVVDLAHHAIHGHRLLDLNREYGLS